MPVLSWNTPITLSGFIASDPHVIIDANGNSTAVWVEQSTYNEGEISQSDTTIIGSSTTFTSSMVGGIITYANGIKVPITAFISDILLTTTTSLTVTNQSYTIYYNGIIAAKYLSLDGSSKDPIKYLSTVGNNAITPKICIDGNGIISVIWSENTIINYASNNDNWSSVISLSKEIGAHDPVMSIDSDGNVAVCWIKNGQIETIIKSISSGIWSSITTFNTSNSDNPSIAIGGGIITIVWQTKPTTRDQIIASTAMIVDGEFSTPVNIIGIVNEGHMHKFPKVAVDSNGNSLVVWFRSDFNGNNIVVLSASLINGASLWNLPLKISSPGMRNSSNLIIRIAIDFVGNCYILWTSSTVENYYNIECSSKQLGNNFNPSFKIINNNVTAKYASMSISSLSDLFITYMYYDGFNSTIQAVETNIGGPPLNNYTLPITISEENTNNAYPCGAITLTDDMINVVAVWQTYDSINKTTTIQLATGSKPLLEPPTNLTVNQTINDFGIFSQFDNTLNWISSTDPNTIGYNIYRDNIFIGQVDFTTTKFIDRNCVTGITVIYSIVSLDKNFQQSRRIEVSIS